MGKWICSVSMSLSNSPQARKRQVNHERLRRAKKKAPNKTAAMQAPPMT